MGKLSETMEFSQIHYKRDYGQTLARRWENLSETMGRPWRDDWKLKRLSLMKFVYEIDPSSPKSSAIKGQPLM